VFSFIISFSLLSLITYLFLPHCMIHWRVRFHTATAIIYLVNDIFPVCGVVLFPMGCRFPRFLKVQT
jgi:hypothetical protein